MTVTVMVVVGCCQQERSRGWRSAPAPVKWLSGGASTVWSVDVFEAIADRRIREAREAGMFDGLTGAGRPIPDLDKERPPGWWAARLVADEVEKVRAEGLDEDLEHQLNSHLRRRSR